MTSIFFPPAGTLLNRGHPINNGLLGCWLLNEGAGQIYKDIAGNADLTGIGNPTRTVGIYGKCVTFSGATTIQNTSAQYLQALNYSNKISAYSTLTISAWVNNIAGAGGGFGGGIIGVRAPGGIAGAFYMSITSTNNQMENSIYTPTGLTKPRITVLSPLKWNYVALVYNGITLTTYVNGVSVDSTAAAWGVFSVNNLPLWVGKIDYNTNTQPFPANFPISNARFYTRALSEKEIKHLYTQPFEGLIIPNSKKYLKNFYQTDTYESGSISDTTDASYITNSAITESGSISDTVLTENSTYNGSVAESVYSVVSTNLQNSVYVGDTSETITISDSVDASYVSSIDVSETITISDSADLQNSVYVGDTSETITISDSVDLQNSVYVGDISETITISDSVDATYISSIDVSEIITISDFTDVTYSSYYGDITVSLSAKDVIFTANSIYISDTSENANIDDTLYVYNLITGNIVENENISDLFDEYGSIYVDDNSFSETLFSIEISSAFNLVSMDFTEFLTLDDSSDAFITHSVSIGENENITDNSDFNYIATTNITEFCNMVISSSSNSVFLCDVQENEIVADSSSISGSIFTGDITEVVLLEDSIDATSVFVGNITENILLEDSINSTVEYNTDIYESICNGGEPGVITSINENLHICATSDSCLIFNVDINETISIIDQTNAMVFNSSIIPVKTPILGGGTLRPRKTLEYKKPEDVQPTSEILRKYIDSITNTQDADDAIIDFDINEPIEEKFEEEPNESFIKTLNTENEEEMILKENRKKQIIMEDDLLLLV